MSHSLPVPPPLPQQMPNNLYARGKCISPAKIQIDECLWAQDYPDLQKACYMARVCQFEKPLICQYKEFESILQEGPTCGLCALSMLLNGAVTSQQLLHSARKKNYSNNGEMFSAHHMFELTCENLSFSKDVQCELHKGRLDCAKIRDYIKAGACLFVPYDSDCNHEPCLKHGRKAHWALIVGYLITAQKEFYVIARHGKAKNMGVWSLSDLSDSNANLIEFEHPKGYPDCDFVLPPGGISGDLGLNERAIIIQGVPQKMFSIT